jgi:GntR family transcriptional repressor for pyruvate dehydrogenase complex
LKALRQISERLDEAALSDVARFLKENANWHSAIAVASHNDLLRAFMTSISGLMLEASHIENMASPDIRKLVTQAHRRILAAIEAQDTDAAPYRAMRDGQAYATHLEAAAKATGRAME